MGEYRESLTLVSPVLPTSFGPVFLKVDHMASERATTSLQGATVNPEFATENSLPE